MSDVWVTFRLRRESDWVNLFTQVVRYWESRGLLPELRSEEEERRDGFGTTLLISPWFPGGEILHWFPGPGWAEYFEFPVDAPVADVVLPVSRAQREYLLWFATLVDDYVAILQEHLVSVTYDEEFPNEHGGFFSVGCSYRLDGVAFPVFGWGDNRSIEACPGLLEYIDLNPMVRLGDDPGSQVVIEVGGSAFSFGANIVNGAVLSHQPETRLEYRLRDPEVSFWKAVHVESPDSLFAQENHPLLGEPIAELGPFEPCASEKKKHGIARILKQRLFLRSGRVPEVVLVRLYDDGMTHFDFGRRTS